MPGSPRAPAGAVVALSLAMVAGPSAALPAGPEWAALHCDLDVGVGGPVDAASLLACSVEIHPPLLDDPDGDGVATMDEVSSNADPMDAASTPSTDDDGDGLANRAERSRLHAMGGPVNLPNGGVQAGPSDFVVGHFGSGAMALHLRSPDGGVLVVTFLPPVSWQPCSVRVTIPPSALGCPVVANMTLDGQVVAARSAYDGAPVPESWFTVHCVPPAGSDGPCLVGAAVDGTWALLPALNSDRKPAGTYLRVQGKAFDDARDDILNGGSGKTSRNSLAYARTWNWHLQGAEVHQACSAGLPALCFLGHDPVEDLGRGRFFA